MDLSSSKVLQQILKAESFLIDNIMVRGQVLNMFGYHIYVPKGFYNARFSKDFLKFIVVNFDPFQEFKEIAIIKDYPVIKVSALNRSGSATACSFYNILKLMYRTYQKLQKPKYKKQRLLKLSAVMFNYQDLLFYLNINKVSKVVLQVLGEPYMYADVFWVYNLT